MPHKSSSLPLNMFYSTVVAETSRVTKTNNNADSFYSLVKPLILKAIKYGAHNDKLSNALKTFLNKHQSYFKYKVKDVQERFSLIS